MTPHHPEGGLFGAAAMNAQPMAHTWATAPSPTAQTGRTADDVVARQGSGPDLS